MKRGSGPIPVAEYKLTATVDPEAEALEKLVSEQSERGWETFGETWMAAREGGGSKVRGDPGNSDNCCSCL